MGAWDVIRRQDTVKKYTEEFVLCPQFWTKYSCAHIGGWTAVRLHGKEKRKIPPKTGLYTLIVQPGIAAHPACSFLVYVGQTNDLKTRFGQYLGAERKEDGRPQVLRFLNRFDSFLWFCFTEVPKLHLDAAEDSLIDAYVPPCNSDIAGQLRSGRRPFRK